MSKDYSLRFAADQAPDAVFDVISDVRGWWDGDIQGPTAAVGDVFTYEHLPQHRSTQRITAADRGSRIVWHVDHAELSFVADPGEWIGTEILFELAPVAAGTEVTFTHRGLVPEVECFEACSSAWAYFVGDALRKKLSGPPLVE